MVIWTLVSLLIDKFTTSLTWEAFFTKVMLIPFAPQQGIYWFIYAIFGIYLLTPILATWLQNTSKCELQFYLLVWAFTLTIPYLTHIHKDIHALIDHKNGVVYYFWGYLWAAVMGYYLRKYVNVSRFKPWHIAAIVGIIATPFALHYFSPLPVRSIDHRLSLPTMALSACYFIIIKHIPLKQKAERIFYNFAEHSFGIYLLHIYIIRHGLWPLFQEWALPTAVAIPMLVITGAAASYLAVALLSHLPKSKYIVGI